MTINLADNDPRIEYTVADGNSQQVFTVPFEFFDDGDLNVYQDGTLKTLTTHYLTADNNDAAARVAHTSGTTGFIHFTTGNVPTASGADIKIVITRSIDIERTTDFPSSGPFDVGALNTALDKVIAIQADLQDDISRSLRLTDFDLDATLTLPAVDSRKGTVLAFNSTTGAAEAGPQTGNVNTLAAISTDINTVAGISANVTTVAGISANVTTVAGISSNVTTVAGIASNVTTVAGIASNVTTVAGISSDVTAVAAISSDIQTVENNITAIQGAAGNATTASTKATEAAASATEAEAWAQKTDGEAQTGEGYSAKAWATGGTGVTDSSGAGSAKEWATDTTNTCDGTEYSAKEYAIGSQSGNTNGSAKQWALGGGASFDSNTAVSGSLYSAKYWAEQAAASADNFDDTYLGPKSSNPSVDNDGDALTAGDLYFNTTSNILRVYNGSAWNDAVVDTTGFATNGFAIAMAIAL
jgi:hypothetical protein